MSLIVDEHRAYLSDAVRLSAYRRAIAEVVEPGHVVLDLASGTGILGLMACEAGASRVYSVEVSGMVEIARAAAAANGFADRVTCVHGLSSEVSLPERVDRIVCDQIGRFGFEAGLIDYGSDARDRFLKPGGRMIPERIDLFLAPVESDELFQQVQFWSSRPAGFDFEPARRWAANTGYPVELTPEALVGCPARAATIDTLTMRSEPMKASAELEVERRGTLHGIGGWFVARLSPSVCLTNAPTAACRVKRRNAFFPIDRAVAVLPGDVVSVAMRIVPDGPMVGWNVRVERAGRSIGHFAHSTLDGMLLCPEDHRRMHPASVPTLSPRGRARLTVLELCDGMRSLAAIERGVFDRHPDLFTSFSEAQTFVAEVVTRYTR